MERTAGTAGNIPRKGGIGNAELGTLSTLDRAAIGAGEVVAENGVINRYNSCAGSKNGTAVAVNGVVFFKEGVGNIHFHSARNINGTAVCRVAVGDQFIPDKLRIADRNISAAVIDPRTAGSLRSPITGFCTDKPEMFQCQGDVGGVDPHTGNLTFGGGRSAEDLQIFDGEPGSGGGIRICIGKDAEDLAGVVDRDPAGVAVRVNIGAVDGEGPFQIEGDRQYGIQGQLGIGGEGVRSEGDRQIAAEVCRIFQCFPEGVARIRIIAGGVNDQTGRVKDAVCIHDRDRSGCIIHYIVGIADGKRTRFDGKIAFHGAVCGRRQFAGESGIIAIQQIAILDRVSQFRQDAILEHFLVVRRHIQGFLFDGDGLCQGIGSSHQRLIVAESRQKCRFVHGHGVAARVEHDVEIGGAVVVLQRDGDGVMDNGIIFRVDHLNGHGLIRAVVGVVPDGPFEGDVFRSQQDPVDRAHGVVGRRVECPVSTELIFPDSFRKQSLLVSGQGLIGIAQALERECFVTIISQCVSAGGNRFPADHRIFSGRQEISLIAVGLCGGVNVFSGNSLYISVDHGLCIDSEIVDVVDQADSIRRSSPIVSIINRGDHFRRIAVVEERGVDNKKSAFGIYIKHGMTGKPVYIGCAADVVAGKGGVGDRQETCNIESAAAAFDYGVVFECGTVNVADAVGIQGNGATPVAGVVPFKKRIAGDRQDAGCGLMNKDRTAVAAPICCGSAVACFVSGKGVGAADIERTFLVVDGTAVAFYGIVVGEGIGAGEIQCSGKKPDRTAAGVF